MDNIKQEQIERKSQYGMAYSFMIVATILLAFAWLIPLAWMIPMTLATKKADAEVGTPIEIKHTALGVCAILFGGLFGIVAGIMILVASSKFNENSPNISIEEAITQ